MPVITCDAISGIERPILESSAELPTTTATTTTIAHRYGKDQVIMDVDCLKSDLKHRFQTRIHSLDLSRGFTEADFADKLKDDKFVVQALLVGTTIMLASKGMSDADKPFALTQDIRVQRMHDMVMAGGTLTDEQYMYLESVLDGDFKGWLLHIAKVVEALG